MKRFLFLCLLIFQFIPSAKAQLVVTDSVDYKEMELFSAFMGRCVVRQVSSGIYLCLATDNVLEESYATLFLGKDKESTLKTIDDLIDLPTSRDKMLFSLGMGGGATTTIKKENNLGTVQLILKTEGVAGEGSIAFTWIKGKLRKALGVRNF